MNMSIRPTFKVGIIIGSQRVVRAGPQITDFVLDTIKAHHATADGPDITFDVIDIAAVNLPLSDEPGVPQKITCPEGYAHGHTRQWSRRVAALDAFVFVSPQYNWGIPAGLKNAIDYLFNEWKGKPAMVVTYGGHGGEKCAAQLKTVLGGGIGMRVVETAVNLSFPGREFLVKAAAGKPLGLNASDDASPWADQRGKIVGVWEDMVKMLA